MGNNRRASCGFRFGRDTDAPYSPYVEQKVTRNSKNEYVTINGNKLKYVHLKIQIFEKLKSQNTKSQQVFLDTSLAWQ